MIKHLSDIGVVYQIYPRSFKDSNHDGIGDLQGIISQLDYLKDLGVDVIWLSPVYCSPNDDNGYDISDYMDINPEYGTMTDMDMLIDTARKIGLRIIMDLVINHTSDEHKWFIESKQKDSPYRDYYLWRDRPNNWTSFFSGSAWDEIEGSYYLHLFSKKQPDLNWKNPKVMEEIQKIMRFWLDKGIYGFRCDVINIIYKTSLENGRKRLVLTGREHYHSQEGCHEILRRLRAEILDHYEAFTVGETVMVTPKQANDLIHPDRKELDMVFSFEHMETDQINNKWFKTKFRPSRWIKVIVNWQEQAHWNANYFENHDQPRSVSRFGDDRIYHKESAKMLATILLTLKGTPFVFQGQELGMTNGDFTSMEQYQDMETHRIYALAKKLHFPKRYIRKMIMRTSRDNARQPMQWTRDGGFSEAKPWLKGNENTSKINAEDQGSDPTSIRSFYQKLIQLRKEKEALKNGLFEPLYTKRDLFVFRRSSRDESYVTIANISKNTRKIPIHLQGEIIQSNYERKNLDNRYLKPYEALILKEDNRT